MLASILKAPTTPLLNQQIQYVLAQKFTAQDHFFLVITTSPQAPIWITAQEAQNFKGPLSTFYKHKLELTEDVFQPVNQFYSDGKFVSQFRYPGGDLYFQGIERVDFRTPLLSNFSNSTLNSTQSSPKQPKQLLTPQKPSTTPYTASFGPSNSLEEALAKALFFPLPTGRSTAFYSKIKQRLTDFPFPQTLPSESYCTWCIAADPAKIVESYIKMKGKGKIGICGFTYYQQANYLQKCGITSSLQFDDDADVIFFEKDQNLKFEVIITNSVQILAQSKKKCLILNSASYQLQYAKFLFKTEKLTEQQIRSTFQAVEIGYLNNILSENNQFQRFLSISNQSGNSNSNSIIYRYSPHINELSRVKQFLDNDIVAQRVFGDNRFRKDKLHSKSHVSYLSFTAFILGQILKNLWLCSDFSEEIPQLAERKVVIEKFLRSFQLFEIQSVLMIVPDFTLLSVKNWLSKVENVDIKLQLHKENFIPSEKLTVFLLGESALISYVLTTQHFEPFLLKQIFPQFALLPFVSTRQIEIILQLLYNNYNLVPPSVFTILATNTIEEQLMIYRQQLPHQSLQEFYQLKQNFFESQKEILDPNKLFNSIINFIKSNGFDGNCAISAPYDYTTLGASIQQENSNSTHLTDKFTRMTVNHYNQNELILQASLPSIFNINKSFNLHVFSSLIYGSKFVLAHRDAEFYKFSGLSYISCEVSEKQTSYYQLELINSFYYLCNTNFDKGMQIYYNNQFPTISHQQQQISDIINKFMNFNNASAAQEIIGKFLAISKESKVTEVNSFDVKKSKNSIKSYVYLPLLGLQNDNFQYVNCYTKSSQSSQGEVTICSECLGGQRAIFYGKNCDICDKVMEQIADDVNSSIKNGKGSQVWKIGEAFHNQESQPINVDFVLNKQVCAVAYQGGVIHDNIVVRGKRREIDPEIFQQLYSFLNQSENENLNREKLVSFISLIDKVRILAYGDVYKGFNEDNNLQNSQALINFLIADQIVQKGGILSNRQFNTFDYLPLSRILVQACPFELFVPFMSILNNFDPQKERLQHQFSFFESACAFVEQYSHHSKDFSEFCKFTIQYIKQNEITSLLDRFLPENHFKFIDEMIQVHLKQIDYGFVPTDFLISTATFISKSIACDNLLITNLMSNIMNFGPKNSIFNKIKISQKHFFNTEIQQQAQLFVLHRFYSQIVKTISCNNSTAFIQQDILNKTVKNFKLNTNTHEINNIIEAGFSTNIFLAGPFGLDIEIKQFNIGVSDYRQQSISKQRKFIQNAVKHTPVVQQSAPVSRAVTPVLQSQVRPLNKMSSFVEQNLPKTIQTPPIYLFFDDVMKKITQQQLTNTIKRITDSYNPRFYYSKKNLLYVPTTQLISPRDFLGYIFGQVPLQQSSNEKEFNVLLQIVSNDIQQQILNKQQSLTKFYPLLEEGKNKLEEASKAVVDLWFYKNISILNQLIIKRFIQSHLDLQRNQIIVFMQDPVFGVGIEQFDKIGQESTLSLVGKANQTADKIYNLSDQQVKDLYSQLISQANSIEQSERKVCVEFLMRFGVSSGMSPFDFFYRCIPKTDMLTRVKNINIVLQLLILCAQYNKEFPFKFEKLTTTSQELKQQIKRMQKARLMQIKLQQYDFLQWLNRVVNVKHDALTAENRGQIDALVLSHINFDFNTIYNAGDLNLNDKKQLENVANESKKIEHMYASYWVVDTKFTQFFADKQNPQNRLMLIDTDKFFINEFNKTDLKINYETMKQLKLTFLGLFGLREDRLTKFLSDDDIQYIKLLFRSICFIWSRSHDYILMHALSETGYAPQSIPSILSTERNKPKRHFDFLRDSTFLAEMKVEMHEICRIYLQVKKKLPDSVSQLPIYENFRDPTDAQILCALELIKKSKLTPQELMLTQVVSIEAVRNRYLTLENAIRCERILWSDPLNKYNFDDIEQKLPILNHKPPPTFVQEPKTIPAITTSQQMPSSQQKVVEHTKLAFFKEDQDIVIKFILERIDKSHMTSQLKNYPDLDSFLFLLSSCQRTNSQDWGKLYSFMIVDPPVKLENSTGKAKEIYQKLKSYAQKHLNISENDQIQTIFDVLNRHIYQGSDPDRSRHELDQTVRLFVAAQLDVAYFHAFNMREAIVRGERNLRMREDIHKALKAMQIMNHNPLNKLVQGTNVQYKRKMALATYLFLCHQPE